MTDDNSTVEGGGEEQTTDPLSQFEGLFKTPTGQAFAQEARIRIADYAQKKQIAEDNLAAGQAFTNNLAEMRGNFVGMVREDPAAVDLALDLAHLGTTAMVGTIPGVDPQHLDNISTGMQRDIARAAVTNVANRHEDMARQMLDHPRISGLLGDEKEDLSGYITGQAVARRIDGEAAQRQAQQAAVTQANRSAWGYMAAAVDPDTGDFNPPPGWAERVMADPSMPPPHKAGLFDVYGRLMENGDAPVSDATTVRDAVRSIASGGVDPTSFLARAGDDLRAADAIYLSKLAGDPSMKRRAGEISATLDAAERALAAPENGPAGQLAYQRFANWLIPTARDGADLNPSSKEYVLQGNRMQLFAPQASDLADYVIGQYAHGDLEHFRPGSDDVNEPLVGDKSNPVSGGYQQAVGVAQRDRLSLDEIFGGGRRVSGDQMIEGKPKPPIGMPVIDPEINQIVRMGQTSGATDMGRKPAGDQVLPRGR